MLTKIKSFIKKKGAIFYIITALLGILDQTTDLLVQLLQEIGAPLWCGTLLRIIIIVLAGLKLLLTNINTEIK